MGFTNEELELQSAEYLPAREVMTGLGGHGKSGLFGGLVAVDLDVHDVNVVKDVNVFTGNDSDGVDIDNIIIGTVF